MESWLEDIANEISVECLPESYQTIAELIGVQNALKLAAHLGGLTFYYPVLDSLVRAKRDERIKQEFNGANHRELARKYGLTESWVRAIVQRKPAYEQTDMFES